MDYPGPGMDTGPGFGTFALFWRPLVFSGPALALVAVLGGPGPAPEPAPGRLRLHLELQQAWADEDFLRRELPWVDWVRDPSEAQVQLILVVEPAAGGGRTYTLRFIGLGPFQGMEDRLTVSFPPATPPNSLRRGLANRIALVLGRFAARLPQAETLEVKASGGPGVPAGSKQDPWKGWVYQVAGSGSFSGETQASNASTSASLGASRITEDDFFRASAWGNWNHSRYALEEEVLRSGTSSYSGTLVVAKGLSPHWTWGVSAGASRSTSANIASMVRVGPALEYNLWKYSESSQRQLTFLYQVGFRRSVYAEETIYGRTREHLADNRLTIALDLNQPWGAVGASLGGSAYLGDWSKYSLGLYAGVSLRIAKGLSFTANASCSRVRDQLALPRSGATDAEVLLRLKELATSYRYYAYLGLTYTFGSIFNGAVNSRFRGAGSL